MKTVDIELGNITIAYTCERPALPLLEIIKEDIHKLEMEIHKVSNEPLMLLDDLENILTAIDSLLMQMGTYSEPSPFKWLNKWFLAVAYSQTSIRTPDWINNTIISNFIKSLNTAVDELILEAREL